MSVHSQPSSSSRGELCRHPAHTHTPAVVFNTGLWGLWCFQRARASRGHRPLQWEQGEHGEYMTWSLQSCIRGRSPAGPIPTADPVPNKDNGGVTRTVSGFPSLSASKGVKSLDNSYQTASPRSSRCPREDRQPDLRAG